MGARNKVPMRSDNVAGASVQKVRRGGKAIRNRGARGELDLRDFLRSWGYSAVRGGGAQAAGGSSVKPDIIHDIPGVHIECKRVEAYGVVCRAVAQAEKDAAPGQMPVVFARVNHDKWVVTMRADEFMKLIALGGLTDATV